MRSIAIDKTFFVLFLNVVQEKFLCKMVFVINVAAL